MVSERTEEEQIEAFKNWWAENGLKTILGIFLIFGGYVGWQSYESKVASESHKQLQTFGRPSSQL